VRWHGAQSKSPSKINDLHHDRDTGKFMSQIKDLHRDRFSCFSQVISMAYDSHAVIQAN
jgi:hypothetical protein